MQGQQGPPQQLAPGVSLLGVAQDETGRPVYIVRDQTNKRRAKGLEAHKSNIAVARALANTLRTSLGPRGMDKILISQDREVTITNDGATIMEKMEVENHIARLLVDLSICQDNEVGDGTTGVVVIAGSLLEQAEDLLDRGIHPIRISEGYEKACAIACSHLETFAEKIDFGANRELLIKSAMTSLGSKIINRYHRQMAEISVDAVLSVADLERRDVDFELIKVRSKIGGNLDETKLINGIILDQEMSHIGMKNKMHNAKIAILTCPFEPPKPKTTYKIDIDSAEKYNSLYKQEQQFFVDMVKQVKDSGCDLVICQWGFDDEANHLLMQAGISAVRWAKAEDMEAIAVATGARIIARFEDLAPNKLGIAEHVEVLTVGTTNDKMMVIQGFDNKFENGQIVPKTITQRISTVFIRGGNAMLIEEAKRSLHDAMCVVRNLVKQPLIIFGGGAAEIACSLKIAEEAEKIKTSEQYALRKYSEALDAIPLALARNSGLQPIETLAKVKKAQVEQQNPRLGVDCLSKGTNDMKEQFVFETLHSKQQQLMLATQVVRMILKIDELIEEDEQV
ncbi:TCP-1_chaperonin subunit epsilon [Hexamita inflata]|uniref:T-complex protein 1 subunit epsilon n=1 Tax=Hexamita inflata TaxID=28002 RepID=A0AA86REE8_9EUKA|nr:TCP-1 chaperonin subunit epsilon [Hexamita inflata]